MGMLSREIFSLESPIAGDPALCLGDCLAELQTLNPAEAVEQARTQEVLRAVLQHFLPRSVEILRLRFGLDREEQILARIAEQLKLSSARVRQIETQALRKLASYLKGER